VEGERYPTLKFWGSLNLVGGILKLGNYTGFDPLYKIDFKSLELGYPNREGVPIAIQINELITFPFTNQWLKGTCAEKEQGAYPAGEVFNNLSSYKNSDTAIKNFEISLSNNGFEPLLFKNQAPVYALIFTKNNKTLNSGEPFKESTEPLNVEASHLYFFNLLSGPRSFDTVSWDDKGIY
jgi:hypothetical protein